MPLLHTSAANLPGIGSRICTGFGKPSKAKRRRGYSSAALRSIASATAAADGAAAGGGFSGEIDVVQLSAAIGIAAALHDRVRQRFALPGLYGCAAAGERNQKERSHKPPGADRSYGGHGL